MSRVIVFATPIFLLLIALEFAWSRRASSRTAGQTPFTLSDALNSLSLGMLSQLVGVLGKVLSISIYTTVFTALGHATEGTFWNAWYGVVLALVFYDLCYYWQHRWGHTVAVFWAAHVVHHQSQHYNLTTALRQTSSGMLLGWIFYVPMALAGVPPVVFGTVLLIDLLYQFWVHTEQVGRLGWFDRWFCSPSNHRVHHAVNDAYIDKNYGGILMVWDHLFGSFMDEDDANPCVYGTRKPLNSWDPLWANLEVYAALVTQSRAARNWVDKVLVWFKPPGWQSADMAAADPHPPFRLADVQPYRPPLTGTQPAFAIAQFVLLLGAVLVFLWNADTMTLAQAAVGCLGVGAGLWALGRYLQGNLHALEVLAVEAAVLATLSGMGWLAGYWVFKPSVMLIAIFFVAADNRFTGTGARFRTLLLAALIGSLAGDVFLMLSPNLFIPGLGSFLVAHLFYIALFRQGQSWFPSKLALAAVLTVGGGMYAIVWGGLKDPVLKGAVAAYVVVISLMASQALGRAATLGTDAAWRVAVGACIFMVSDSFIAINKFVSPVPWSEFWILATYYAAQLLIVHNVAVTAPGDQAANANRTSPNASAKT